jgi:hypothetical protein
MVAIWRDESKEPMEGRIRAYEFTGGFFVLIAEDGHTLSIPGDILQTVELRELTAEDEKSGYKPDNTFREGENSPWFPGMGVPSK